MAINLIDEIVELRRSILRMGATVEQRVGQSLDALRTGDIEAARVVRAGDDEIDEMEVDIEQECLRVLALLQPVAGDLRFVLAVMRIATTLERIGDLARSIAKRVIDLDGLGPFDVPPSLQDMSEQTRSMLSEALTALSDDDAALARQVRDRDERVDDLQREIFAWVQQEIPRHVEATEAAIDILTIARKLERIADHSTNIAEEVIFHAEGAVVRHS